MTDKSKSNSKYNPNNNNDDKLTSNDINKFQKAYNTVDITWIENLVKEKDIEMQKFYRVFQFNYRICYEKRNELKVKLDQDVSNIENILKNINFEKYAFVIEMNCNSDVTFSFRYQDSSNQFKYTKKLVRNKSIFIIEVKSYKDSFYIISEKNEEYLFKLEERFCDLILGNNEEICISKLNKINVDLSISTKYEYDDEFIVFKKKLSSMHDINKKSKELIKKFEDVLFKIKDYKSQNHLEYLKTMGELAKLAFSSKDNSKDHSSTIDNTKVINKNILMKKFKKNTPKDVIPATPQFGLENEILNEDTKQPEKIKSESLKISEFNTEDLDISRNESMNNLSNLDFLLKNIEEDYTKAKPINPLNFKDEQDKSMDNSVISGINVSQISENKFQSYAQKTKKLNMEKIKSFKSFNFQKNKNIENKYDDEFNNIDEKSKAVYNACENFSSNVQNSRNHSLNANQTKNLTNPFNISSKITKLQKPTTHINMDIKPQAVKFNFDEVKDNKENEKNTLSSRNEQKHQSDINTNKIIDLISTSNLSKAKSQYNDSSLQENNEQRRITTQESSQINLIIIDSKLKALVSDPKLKNEKVFRTGSLLSILNLGIKTTPIFSSSNVNVADVRTLLIKIYITAKKKKEQNNE